MAFLLDLVTGRSRAQKAARWSEAGICQTAPAACNVRGLLHMGSAVPTPAPPFELDVLRTFVAVADAGGFSKASARVERTQSTISIQVRKLEDALGRRLFERAAGQRNGLLLTPEGEILLTYARQILHLCDEIRSRIMEPDVAGRVRLGTPEDFASTHLPDLLARFARAHPRIALEVNCDFTANLLDGFAKGQYDLILVKREAQPIGCGLAGAGGSQVWREVLLWAAGQKLVLDPGEPLPLVLAPAPDIYRKRAMQALDEAGIQWRISYTSPSLAGLQAAVKAGLGITVLPKEMVTSGLVVIGRETLPLPPLPDTEVVLHRAPGKLSKAADTLSDYVVHALEAEQAKAPDREGRALQG